MALARTRQAVSVHKAMIFQSQGNPARCPHPFHACTHTCMRILLAVADPSSSAAGHCKC